MSDITWSVFAKPWAELSGAALGALLGGIGFSGVEIPVRENAFVTPETAQLRLPGFAAELADHGVAPISIAGSLDESMFAACAAAGVPVIRIMAPIRDDGYAASIQRLRDELEAAAPLTEHYGVGVGIQPHHGAFVTSTFGVLDLIDGLPEAFTVVWDAGHDALAGDDPATTLALAMGRVGIVNLKNAVYRKLSDDGSTTSRTLWRSWWVEGAEGLSNWTAVTAALRGIGFAGPICLSAQYADPSGPVEEVVARDLALAKRLYAAG